MTNKEDLQGQTPEQILDLLSTFLEMHYLSEWLTEVMTGQYGDIDTHKVANVQVRCMELNEKLLTNSVVKRCKAKGDSLLNAEFS